MEINQIISGGKDTMKLHIIPRYQEAEKWCELAEELDAAFEYNEFFIPSNVDNKELCRTIIDTYKALPRDRSMDTLHGAFFDIVVNSSDPEVRANSYRRCRESMEIAEELGCRAVIFHTNYITGFKSFSYREKWVFDNADFYRKLLAEFPTLSIFVENMFDDTPELLKKLAVEMRHEERFGVCFDIAHAFLWDFPLEAWIDELGPYIKHIHANDNKKDEDSHMPIGDGRLPWLLINNGIFKRNRCSFLIEVNGMDNVRKSYEYLTAHHLYFFDRRRRSRFQITTDMKRILDMGISLTAERNYNRLLDLIVSEAMSLTHCEAGTLYIYREGKLHFGIMRNDVLNTYSGSMGEASNMPPVAMEEKYICAYSAIHRKSINIPDVYQDSSFDWKGPKEYDHLTGYHTQSMLVLPLINHEDELIGVMQLMNARDDDNLVCEFGEDQEFITLSLASQAAISLSNMIMLKELKDLMYSFVSSFATVIDARTPYNAKHTNNVAQYCMKFIDYLNGKHAEGATKLSINDEMKEQVYLAAMLHDVGKIITPLSVMNKSDRLSTMLPIMRMRWKLIREILENKKASAKEASAAAEADAQIEELKANIEFTENANTCGFLDDEAFARIDGLKGYSYKGFDDEEIPFITEEECEELKIRKGTLTAKERAIIEEHVVYTDKILEKISFGAKYDKVRFFAGAHHEFINGKGYPKGLSADEIPLEVRILTIMDVFDSLSASDRPYRKQSSLEDTFEILRAMAGEGKLDADLVEMVRDCFLK
ncbi:MAG: TIM barrel protein [Lachnospiraceae bacterium]|nr:TIM barrel protein [Lachnospiraceae bacterium]